LKRPAAVAIALLVALAAPVSAATENDPEDVKGKLDVVRIKFKKSQDTATLTIETAEDWKCRYLRASRDTKLQWRFDDGSDGDIDLKGDFVCDDGHLLFLLAGTDSGNNYEPLEGERPDKKTAKVTMPLDITELESDSLAVLVKSKDGEAKGCATACRDRAPDTGKMTAY
jgi:hypothetical protein